MVKRGPPVRIDNIKLSLAPKDLFKCALFLESVHTREDYFVNRSLSNDRCLGIDVFSAVDQILQILGVGSLGCICQGLKDIAGVLVFGYFQRVFRIGC